MNILCEARGQYVLMSLFPKIFKPFGKSLNGIHSLQAERLFGNALNIVVIVVEITVYMGEFCVLRNQFICKILVLEAFSGRKPMLVKQFF